MNRTEEFNRIMSRVNEAHESKRKQKSEPITTIKPRDNMNDLQTSISKCTIKGNAVLLPEERLDNYQEVRKALLNAGGEYKRNSFVFKTDPTAIIDALMGGSVVNLKKEFQAFFTPEDIAEWMAQNLFVTANDKILEPNGGGGALINAIRKEGHTNQIHTYELNPIYSAELQKMPDVILLGYDFLKADSSLKFDKIIANPPFSKNQDIDHIYKMWDTLAPKGRIVTVCSTHWTFANGKKEQAFRAWIDEREPDIYPLDSGRFKSSGTMINSQILVIDR